MENLQANVVIEYVEQEEGYRSGKHLFYFKTHYICRFSLKS